MAPPATLLPSAASIPNQLPGSRAGGRPDVIAAAGRRCACCRLLSDRLDLGFRNGDPADWSDANLIAVCPLCLAGQRLQRRHADRECLPVWLPEMDQGALVRLVRAIHDALHARGHSPVISLHTLPPEDTASIRCWLIAYLTLADRARRLGAMLGGSLASPSRLYRVFRSVDPARPTCPPKLAMGLRFLPLGRWFEEDRDIYGTWLRAPVPGSGLDPFLGTLEEGATGGGGGGGVPSGTGQSSPRLDAPDAHAAPVAA